jgi:Ca-activated chloride channel family protein
MSLHAPLVLLALIAIPVAAWVYSRLQRRRGRVAAAFVSEPLKPSVAPTQPGWRRHAPIIAFGVALIVLIVAAARPQRSVAVPLTDGAVLLANDVSSSMAAKDVNPSRLGAAQRADVNFLAHVPSTIRVGLLEFNDAATILQSPTKDHALTRAALTHLHANGHTAIGTAVQLATHVLSGLRSPTGRRVPSAIVLLSDGTSTTGADPLTAARDAGAAHIPVYTVALGTGHGTITVTHPNGTTRTVPVPLNPSELQQIARLSKGRSFTIGSSAGLSAVYAHLAAQLGHKHVSRQMTASFAGAGFVLLLLGSAMSLRWFGRLA